MNSIWYWVFLLWFIILVSETENSVDTSERNGYSGAHEDVLVDDRQRESREALHNMSRGE